MGVLSNPVLVLNRGRTPIGVVGLKRAIGLLSSTYKDGSPKAHIIDPNDNYRWFTWEDWAVLIPREGDKVIRSAHRDHRVPEVVICSRYNKLPNQRLHFSRRTVYKRDNNMCQYCGKKPGTGELTIDHVVPRAQGGQTTWENCVLCCTECNRYKANRTPKQANLKLLKTPVKPKFNLIKSDYRCKSWEAILGEAYWEIELENDME